MLYHTDSIIGCVELYVRPDVFLCSYCSSIYYYSNQLTLVSPSLRSRDITNIFVTITHRSHDINTARLLLYSGSPNSRLQNTHHSKPGDDLIGYSCIPKAGDDLIGYSCIPKPADDLIGYSCIPQAADDLIGYSCIPKPGDDLIGYSCILSVTSPSSVENDIAFISFVR